MINPKVVAQNFLNEYLTTNGQFSGELPDEWHYCNDMVKDDPVNALELITELVNISNSLNEDEIKYNWLYYIAAGPLEGIIADHGEVVMDAIVDLMASNDMFLFACTGVWPRGQNTNDRVWLKFQSNLGLHLQKNQRISELQQKYR